jgi:prevent-host-death family protein
MKTINLSKARNSFPSLIDEVLQCRRPMIVVRHGKPVAKIAPVEAESAKGNPYPLRKVPIRMSKDFNAPMPESWSAVQS